MALNPPTAVDEVIPYMEMVDMILVMTVNPGFGGQSYIDECTEKVEVLRAVKEEYNMDLAIQVDGGVTLDNVNVPLEAGANVIVAGSAVYKGNVEENVKSGGFGEHVCAYMEACHPGCRVIPIAIWDRFVPHGSIDSLRCKVGLSAAEIAQTVETGIS